MDSFNVKLNRNVDKKLEKLRESERYKRSVEIKIRNKERRKLEIKDKYKKCGSIINFCIKQGGPDGCLARTFKFYIKAYRSGLKQLPKNFFYYQRVPPSNKTKLSCCYREAVGNRWTDFICLGPLYAFAFHPAICCLGLLGGPALIYLTDVDFSYVFFATVFTLSLSLLFSFVLFCLICAPCTIVANTCCKHKVLSQEVIEV